MNKQVIFIAIFLVALVAVVVGWVVLSKDKGEETPLPGATPPQAAAPTEGSLGAEISEKAQNPLKDRLPETNPLGGVNPLEGAYENPFGE